MARIETLTGWIARDEATEHNPEGQLALFDEFPERTDATTYNGVVISGYWAPKNATTKVVELPGTMFPGVTWESAPVYVKLTIEELQ